MMRLLAVASFVLVLAACQVFGSGSSGGVENISPVDPIQWDRSPNTVIFRAEVTGGEYENAFFARNEVPPCTIYGDNRIVWTASPDYINTKVLWDRLTDTQIRWFIGTLTVDDRIYTYDSGAEYEPPSEVSPVVEKITVFVSGVEHTTDAFGQWPPGYFQDVLQLCQGLSQSPVEFLPDAAWLSAQGATDTSGIPTIAWDSNASGLNLKELADSGERHWTTGRNVQILWRLLRSTAPDVHFTDENGEYQIAVEVPGINPSAPPAPSG